MSETQDTTEREIWKPVAGWESYEVSSLGSVRRRSGGQGAIAGKKLKPFHDIGGYPTVKMYSSGKRRNVHVHRLVADAFLGPRPNGIEVNHISGNKHDASSFNLEYVTRSENVAHAIKVLGIKKGRQITSENLSSIRADYSNGISRRLISRKYGISLWCAAKATSRNPRMINALAALNREARP